MNRSASGMERSRRMIGVSPAVLLSDSRFDSARNRGGGYARMIGGLIIKKKKRMNDGTVSRGCCGGMISLYLIVSIDLTMRVAVVDDYDTPSPGEESRLSIAPYVKQTQ